MEEQGVGHDSRSASYRETARAKGDTAAAAAFKAEVAKAAQENVVAERHMHCGLCLCLISHKEAIAIAWPLNAKRAAH